MTSLGDGRFDSVVSLGYNCEVEFQLERIGLREKQPVFAWMFVRLPSLTKIVNNGLAGLAEPKHLVFRADETTMIYDSVYECAYHRPKELTPDHPRAARLMQIFEQSVRSAADRFNENARSSNRTLYLVKVEPSRTLGELIRLRDAIEGAYPDHDFQLAVVREGCSTDARWRERCISQHIVAQFAPIEAAMNGSIPCWDNVFHELGLLPAANGR